ncbi:hypothetical protein C1752_04539 [Acaryochloris thomasi RCC1774]|uniref:Uncharacterized protein n=1 Tax=Acaryochloris thomasi RCC1774 TaxID=1764569 RepID=A0A2W1JD34_9CYAN|nr:hypothetical protein C1752_04539 [Acaryochloris thomasi RCC1774]
MTAKCPRCDRTVRKKGLNASGSQRYTCPHDDCEMKSFTVEAKPITGRPRGSVGKCPKCGSNWTKKSGKVGTSYALCNNCGNSFKLSLNYMKSG